MLVGRTQIARVKSGPDVEPLLLQVFGSRSFCVVVSGNPKQSVGSLRRQDGTRAVRVVRPSHRESFPDS